MLERKLFASILSSDMGELREEVKRIEQGGVDGIHIDVMDGHFVNNLTYGFPIIRALKKITNLPLDVHLMISNPEQWVEKYCNEGISYLSLHYETYTHLDETLRKIKSKDVKAGIAFNPSSHPSNISPYIFNNIADFVLFMTVNPGFGGQKFISGVLQNIDYIRSKYPHLNLQIDGGIDFGEEHVGQGSTAYRAAKHSINLFVAGSAVFIEKYKDENYKTPIKLLKQEIEKGALIKSQ